MYICFKLIQIGEISPFLHNYRLYFSLAASHWSAISISLYLVISIFSLFELCRSQFLEEKHYSKNLYFKWSLEERERERERTLECRITKKSIGQPKHSYVASTHYAKTCNLEYPYIQICGRLLSFFRTYVISNVIFCFPFSFFLTFPLPS